MDDRTARLLDALEAVGVDLLVELLPRPSTEHELLTTAEDADQTTVNRRLHRLRKTGVVAQETGKARAPGRLWTVVHPAETEALLEALFALARAIDERDRERRDEAEHKLKLAKAGRLGIRAVDSPADSR